MRNEYNSAPVQRKFLSYSNPIRRLAAATKCASLSCRGCCRVQAFRKLVSSRTTVRLTSRTATIPSCDRVKLLVVGCAHSSWLSEYTSSLEAEPQGADSCIYARVCWYHVDSPHAREYYKRSRIVRQSGARQIIVQQAPGVGCHCATGRWSLLTASLNRT